MDSKFITIEEFKMIRLDIVNTVGEAQRNGIPCQLPEAITIERDMVMNSFGKAKIKVTIPIMHKKE